MGTGRRPSWNAFIFLFLPTLIYTGNPPQKSAESIPSDSLTHTHERARAAPAHTLAPSHPLSLSLSPCCARSHRLATGGGDKQVFLWDVATGQKIRRFRGHDSAVNAVEFAADDSVVRKRVLPSLIVAPTVIIHAFAHSRIRASSSNIVI